MIHVSSDDGGEWTDVTPDEVDGLYISCIEPSAHDPDTAYVAVDGHRSDHFDPILLLTEDRGRSWTSILGDLPDGAPPETIREDPNNPSVLYIGTENAAYVTIDRGEHWIKLNGDTLPTVAVDDIAIQPREMDIVAGTHGRSIYVLDDASPLSQLTQEVLDSDFHLFNPLPARPVHRLMLEGLWGDDMFVAQNPPIGASITYWLNEHSPDPVSVTIADEHGRTLRTLTGPANAGLNRVTWDLLPEPNMQLDNPHFLAEFVPPATYTVTVSSGENTASADLQVLPLLGKGDHP